MNILIVNQPTGNRGDESAHRALVRSLVQRFPNDSIDIVFVGESRERVKPIIVKSENVSYHTFPIKKGRSGLPLLAFKWHLERLFMFLIPPYRHLYSFIKKADYIICAPGGICMGGFMNWEHILILKTVLRNNKPLAYYSRSFGPFSENNKIQRLFFNESKKILNSFDFLSIRDKKTMDLANKMNLTYVPSIDTAFLEVPSKDSRILNLPFKNDKYVVFVPNSLTWHPAYSQRSSERIQSFYLDIIELLKKKFESYTIVLMPQLFGDNNTSDYLYFKKLANLDNTESICVLDESYNSDMQQCIISKSAFVIGARYHSIVFAINNKIPFVSLSYEHKLFGLLQILNSEDCQVDITNVGDALFEHEKVLSKISTIIDQRTSQKVVKRQEEAAQIASDCFKHLCERIYH